MLGCVHAGTLLLFALFEHIPDPSHPTTSNMMLISQEYENIILCILDELDPPKRTRILDNRTCFRAIVCCLDLNIPWRYLPIMVNLECDWSTIKKRFDKWVSMGVFITIWTRIMQMYADFKTAKDPKWFKDLFIDSTHVRNRQGRDCLGRNALDRARRNTKVSCLCDQDGIVLSCQMFPSNYNDCKTTEDAVDGIRVNIMRDKRRSFYVIGDKGYISIATYRKLNPRKITLLTPYKKNQVNRHLVMTNANRQRLKHRFIIEHVFNRLDAKRRLLVRYDHNIACFEAFHSIAFISMMEKAILVELKSAKIPSVSDVAAT